MGAQGDIVLSDLGMYMIGMRQDLRVDTSIHSRFEYDETGIRFVARLDGQCAVAVAHAILNDATS
jgi:HK97 family phage major capsid protein